MYNYKSGGTDRVTKQFIKNKIKIWWIRVLPSQKID